MLGDYVPLTPGVRAALGAFAGSGLGYGGGALARWLAPNAVSKRLPLYMAAAGAPLGAVTFTPVRLRDIPSQPIYLHGI